VLFLLGLLSVVGGSVVAALGDGGAAFWLSLVFGGAMAAVACLGLQWHGVITAWILTSKPGTDPLTKLLQYVTLVCGWLILVGSIGFFTHTGLLFAYANPILPICVPFRKFFLSQPVTIIFVIKAAMEQCYV